MKEIERKFLVTSLAFLAEATDALPIDQGYLHSTRPTVRVRRRGDQGFLTLKTPWCVMSTNMRYRSPMPRHFSSCAEGTV